jgi:hypothetical protein
VIADQPTYWWNRCTGETTWMRQSVDWCASYCFEQRAWFFWRPERMDLPSEWEMPDIEASSSTERPGFP